MRSSPAPDAPSSCVDAWSAVAAAALSVPALTGAACTGAGGPVPGGTGTACVRHPAVLRALTRLRHAGPTGRGRCGRDAACIARVTAFPLKLSSCSRLQRYRRFQNHTVQPLPFCIPKSLAESLRVRERQRAEERDRVAAAHMDAGGSGTGSTGGRKRRKCGVSRAHEFPIPAQWYCLTLMCCITRAGLFSILPGLRSNHFHFRHAFFFFMLELPFNWLLFKLLAVAAGAAGQKYTTDGLGTACSQKRRAAAFSAII